MSTAIEQFKASLLKAGLAGPDDLVGCAISELAAVGRLSPLPLPNFYNDFLLSMGRRAGGFLRGTDTFYPLLLELKEGANEILRDDQAEFQLAATDFVFLMHQGYQFAYISLLEGGDPLVYFYHEGNLKPQSLNKSLSSFFVGMVDGAITTARGR